jgi:hypothetical protein
MTPTELMQVQESGHGLVKLFKHILTWFCVCSQSFSGFIIMPPRSRWGNMDDGSGQVYAQLEWEAAWSVEQ